MSDGNIISSLADNPAIAAVRSYLWGAEAAEVKNEERGEEKETEGSRDHYAGHLKEKIISLLDIRKLLHRPTINELAEKHMKEEGSGKHQVPNDLIIPSVKSLTSAEVRRNLDQADFKDLNPDATFPVTGQDRLVDALKRASEVRDSGFNPVVTRFNGPPEMILDLLKGLPPGECHPKDFAYVRNFDDPKKPVLLTFEAGKAKPFQEAIEKALEQLTKELQATTGEPDFVSSVVEANVNFGEKSLELRSSLGKELSNSGFQVIQNEKANPEDPERFQVGVRMVVPEVDEHGSQVMKDNRPKMMVNTLPFQLFLQNVSTAEQVSGQKMVFTLMPTPFGPAVAMAPQKEYEEAAKALKAQGKPVNPAFDLEALRSKYKLYSFKLLETEATVRSIDGETDSKLTKLTEEFVRKHFDLNFEEIRKNYSSPEVAKYLDGMKEALVKNHPFFVGQDPHGEGSNGQMPPSQIREILLDSLKPKITSTSAACGETAFPVVFVKDPTWKNLFGTVEEPDNKKGVPADLYRHKLVSGEPAVLKANEGYLVANILDLAENGTLWELMKVAQNGTLQIEPPSGRIFPPTTTPQPIPVNLKIVLLDREGFYDYLKSVSPHFAETFKLEAPFRGAPEADLPHLKGFAQALLGLSEKEGLLPMTPGATAATLEQAMRGRESQKEFFEDVNRSMDLIREASAIAKENGREAIWQEDVTAALQARKHRQDLFQTRQLEMLKEGIWKVKTRDFYPPGEINALAVYESNEALTKGLGDILSSLHFTEEEIKEQKELFLKSREAATPSFGAYPFGIPHRTAVTVNNAKDAKIIANDEKPQVLGPTTLKGLQNMESYFKEKFGYHGNPLTFEARLSYEQLYGGMDGDSATQTNTIAVHSAFSGIPVKAGMAITGSMDVHGKVQAIGGVNEKIEGFFDVCKAQGGLTGEQGVIIPASNVKDLMLRHDIVEAIKSQAFFIWPVETVEQSMEIMMGVPAGARDPETGKYPENTINGQIEKRLELFLEKNKAMASPPSTSHNMWNLAAEPGRK